MTTTNTNTTATTTKSDVVAELHDLVGKGLLVDAGNGRFEVDGTYILRHGEYARPQYTPTRYKDGWGVAEVTFFLPGTLNAPKGRQRVELWSEYDEMTEWHRLQVDRR